MVPHEVEALDEGVETRGHQVPDVVRDFEESLRVAGALHVVAVSRRYPERASHVEFTLQQPDSEGVAVLVPACACWQSAAQ